MTVGLLVLVVTQLTTQLGRLATSPEIRRELDRLNVPWDRNGFSGGILDDVARVAVQGNLLAKWKARGSKNALTGLSPSVGSGLRDAKAFALRSGWDRIVLHQRSWVRAA